ncbi:hypothetical protein THRCLA_21387 [Thraustotheca clavata]|uniref:Uncharacterized protein n=1 Tax=Thraustotheca clavata TaxID=74557 RepID=A0A1V9ZX94_9STRA|nr:hypothetical protein THRCLA_21387 [Thraustotheca clavata]
MDEHKMTPEEKTETQVDPEAKQDNLSPEELIKRGAVGRRNGVTGIQVPQEVNNNNLSMYPIPSCIPSIVHRQCIVSK